MKNMVHNNAKIVISIVVSVLSIFILWFTLSSGKEKPSKVEQFIEQHMRNENGTWATYLQEAPSVDQNIVAGREALSESLGLWMQYAILQQDQSRLNESVEVLRRYFISPQKYIYWKLQPSGQSDVSTNALGDDLRIVDSLLKAYALWKDEAYLSIAKDITSTLQTEVQHSGYFVDFHDFKNKISSDTLSLVYIDISALKGMLNNGLISDSEYTQHKDLLLQMPSDGPFYPKTYQVQSKKYTYDESVNLIDQLIVGIHLTEAGKKPEELVQFLKQEFEQRHQLVGRYNLATHAPNVTYESPAVYGLAMLLAIQCDDVDWAKQLQKRMVSFRDQDKDYPGGYVFDNNTHFFDNLFPLLAETTLNTER